MSYLHIANLYRPEAQRILEFKQVFVMEKIHGTSAHVAWKDNALRFFSGGSKHETFVALFAEEQLQAAFSEMANPDVTVYGEAYGGKIQGMSKVYGPKIRFVAFEVKIGGSWLSVPQACDIAVNRLGLDFVCYDLSATDIESLNEHRDANSAQAMKNGMGEHPREGIVIRPPFEVILNNGERLIAKYKTEAFQERTREPKIGEDLKTLTDAEAAADEWVTNNRMEHVLDSLCSESVDVQDITATGAVIKRMYQDIEREGAGELEFSKMLSRAIGQKTAKMFKQRLQTRINEG